MDTRKTIPVSIIMSSSGGEKLHIYVYNLYIYIIYIKFYIFFIEVFIFLIDTFVEKSEDIVFLVSFCLLLVSPKGRLGMSDITLLSAISGLLFDSPFLSPLLFLSA